MVSCPICGTKFDHIDNDELMDMAIFRACKQCIEKWSDYENK